MRVRLLNEKEIDKYNEEVRIIEGIIESKKNYTKEEWKNELKVYSNIIAKNHEKWGNATLKIGIALVTIFISTLTLLGSIIPESVFENLILTNAQCFSNIIIFILFYIALFVILIIVGVVQIDREKNRIRQCKMYQNK